MLHVACCWLQVKRITTELLVFRRGGDPAAQTGAGFGHRRRSLTLEVQRTLSLTQPAGGVAGPTKNENWENFHASQGVALAGRIIG